MPAEKKKPPTFDHLRSQKKPVIKTTWICMDEEIGEAYDDAKREMDLAELAARARPDDIAANDRLVAAKEAYDAAKEAYRDNSVAFKLKSCGRKKYDNLIGNHPPTSKQIEESKAAGQGRPPFNGDTFMPALIQACLVEPDLTLDEIKEICDDWSVGEVATIFSTALDACTSHRVVDLGKG